MTFRKGQHVKIKQAYMDSPGTAVGQVIAQRGTRTRVAFLDWFGGEGPNWNEAVLPTIQLQKARRITRIEWV